MPTIGTKLPRKYRGDRAAHCDYCGVRWYRSQLVRDRAGLLACPDDRRGKDVATLSEENAQGAKEYGRKHYALEQGSYFVTDGTATPVQRMTRDDI